MILDEVGDRGVDTGAVLLVAVTDGVDGIVSKLLGWMIGASR